LAGACDDRGSQSNAPMLAPFFYLFRRHHNPPDFNTLFVFLSRSELPDRTSRPWIDFDGAEDIHRVKQRLFRVHLIARGDKSTLVETVALSQFGG
jgi:hypothetical protein